MALQARQTGKSTMGAVEAVIDCCTRKTKWVALSSGERQSKQWMLKAHSWAKVYDIFLAKHNPKHRPTECYATEMNFFNGSSIYALPANPDTSRGYSANLLLDEFAFHKDPAAIWRSIYPSITSNWNGKFKLRILSTPNGMDNKFYELFTGNNSYSKYKKTRLGSFL
jgi:phage FluMu gp28-like protein